MRAEAAAGPDAHDAIVVGGGHNGLVAAALLARRGHRVVVLERAERFGGMMRSGPFAPGEASVAEGPWLAHLLYNLDPGALADAGLALPAGAAVPTVSLAPDGRHVVLRDATASLVDGSPHPDAAAYAALRARLVRFAGVLVPLQRKPPPGAGERPGRSGAGRRQAALELAGLARVGLDLKRLGRDDMREFLRVVMSNVHDLVLDVMPDGPLAGAVAADAVLGTWSGPRSPGSVMSLMQRWARGGGASVPAGGFAGLVEALCDGARAQGATLRARAAVSRVLVEDDRACGVELEDGEVVRARAVLSSLGALATLRLAGPEHFDAETCRRMRNLRCKGTAAKVNLALRERPTIDGLPGDLAAGRLLVAPSSDHVERAFDPAKYGAMSEAPVLEAVLVPGASDSDSDSDSAGAGASDSAGGACALSVVMQYAPHALDGGWDDAARRRLAAIVVETLEAHMPGLGELVVASQVLAPPDIERETGAPGGHWHHGERSVDQSFTLRPGNGVARYAFAVPGLYLCGAAAHPGGDVTGWPGRNAALRAVADGVLA